MNTTLRKELTKAGFDWSRGTIVLQPATPDSHCPWWGEVAESITLSPGETHPLLDLEYHDGFGSLQCPRFIADDGDSLYFPAQYDGYTWVCRVRKDIRYYADKNHPAPYVGC